MSSPCLHNRSIFKVGGGKSVGSSIHNLCFDIGQRQGLAVQQSHRIEVSVQELGQKDSGLAFLNDVRNHRCLVSEMLPAQCALRATTHGICGASNT